MADIGIGRGGEPADASKVAKLKPPSRRHRDGFCFFDNTDVKLRAPFDAQRLMEKVEVLAGGQAS